MDNYFQPISNGVSIELLLFISFFVGVTIIRVANPKHLPYILGFHIVSSGKRKQDLSILSKNDSKSSLFLNFFYVLFFSLLLQKLFGLNYLIALALGAGLFSIKLIGWFTIQQFISKKSEMTFLKSRFLINETMAFGLFFYLLIYHYVPHDVVFVYFFASLIFFLALVRISTILTNYISIFHNVLYLCALEILPVLVLVKLITKYII